MVDDALMAVAGPVVGGCGGYGIRSGAPGSTSLEFSMMDSCCIVLCDRDYVGMGSSRWLYVVGWVVVVTKEGNEGDAERAAVRDDPTVLDGVVSD